MAAIRAAAAIKAADPDRAAETTVADPARAAEATQADPDRVLVAIIIDLAKAAITTDLVRAEDVLVQAEASMLLQR